MNREGTSGDDVRWRQLAGAGDHLYVAEQLRRTPQGPNGENTEVTIRHSTDAGQTWMDLPWRRNPFSLGGYLVNWWPPTEFVNMSVEDGKLKISYPDEDVSDVTCVATYDPKHRWWCIQIPRPLFFGK